MSLADNHFYSWTIPSDHWVTSSSFHPILQRTSHPITPYHLTTAPYLLTQDLTPDPTPSHHTRNRTDLPRPRWVNEFQPQVRWRWKAHYTHGPQTHGRQTARSRVTQGGGSDHTCPCQWGGEGTSASIYYWSLPTLLLSQRRWLHWLKASHARCLRRRLNFRVCNPNLDALDSPGYHNHSRTTSLPRSYILHSTLQFPYNTSIPTHIHI